MKAVGVILLQNKIRVIPSLSSMRIAGASWRSWSLTSKRGLSLQVRLPLIKGLHQRALREPMVMMEILDRFWKDSKGIKEISNLKQDRNFSIYNIRTSLTNMFNLKAQDLPQNYSNSHRLTIF
jgi:hypothetical protein